MKKMEVMLRRNTFRDYYDIYSMLKAGLDFHKSVDSAAKYSGHKLKTKNIISILTRSDEFIADSNFKNWSPKYNVSSQDIANYIKGEVHNIKNIRISERAGQIFFKAEINGEDLLSVSITKEDYFNYREQKIDAFSLVEEYYANGLKSQQYR